VTLRFVLRASILAVVLASAVPAAAAAAEKTKKFSLHAMTSVDSPLDTGISAKRVVSFTCSGTIPVNQGCTDRDASPDGQQGRIPVRGGTVVLYRSGTGPWKSISGGANKVTGNGTLQLAINDCCVEDNGSGAFTIQVVSKVDPKPGAEIDWTMPTRLSSRGWSLNEGLAINDVYPKDGWRANLFLLRDDKVIACSSKERWRWVVDPPGKARVLSRPRPGCKASMRVDRLDTYTVEAIRQKRKGGKWVDGKTKNDRTKRRVVVRDWLFTAFGDSNGSGEGNPPFEFERCNRSSVSHQWQVAESVERIDPRTSVTMLFASCSGAVIRHLTRFDYDGIRSGDGLLLPQIRQVARHIVRPTDKVPDRTVDAAIVSAGVNDLGFGSLISYCVFNDVGDNYPCEEQRVVRTARADGGTAGYNAQENGERLRDHTAQLVSELPAAYLELAGVLRRKLNLGASSSSLGLGVVPRRVFATHYPEFTTGTDGTTCKGRYGLAQWGESTWQWLALTGQQLNNAVSSAGGLHGWTAVTIPGAAYSGHGYCAADSWFKGILESIQRRNPDGPFHPDARAHAVAAGFTRLAVCNELYGTADCKGLAKE